MLQTFCEIKPINTSKTPAAQAPSAPAYRSPTGIGANYNIHWMSYFEKHDTLIDRGRVMAPLNNPVRDAKGLIEIAPGASQQWLAWQTLNAESQTINGNYVITFPAALTTAVTGNMGQVVKSSKPGRIELSIDVSPILADLGAHYISGLAESFIHITVTNPTPLPVTPVVRFFRAEHETALSQGKVWGPEFVSHLQTASQRPIRTMQAQGAIDAWIETPSDIPKPTGYGHNGFDIGLQDSGQDDADGVRKYTAKRGGPGSYASPEDLGALSTETGRDLAICLHPMMTDAALTAYLTRLRDTMPAARKIFLEPDNEGWIAGMPNTWWARTNYAAANGLAKEKTMATNQYADQLRSLAHFTLRAWKAAETIFGAARVVRVLGHQTGNHGTHQMKANVVDVWGIHTRDARLGDIAQEHTGGAYLNLGMSFPDGVGPGQGTLFADLKAKAHQDSSYTRGNAAAYWDAKIMAAVAAGERELDAWNAMMAQQRYTVPRRTMVYEGPSPHVNCSFYRTWGPGAAHLALKSNGAVMLPATVTLPLMGADRTENHSSESIAFFENNDRVAIWHASNPTLLRRGFLCRVVAGGLKLYVDRAAYNADKPLAVPSGTTAFVVNETRLSALYSFVHDRFRVQTAWVSDWVSRMGKKGIHTVAYYAFDHANTAYPEVWRDSADIRPWRAWTNGVRGTPSALMNYLKNLA